MSRGQSTFGERLRATREERRLSQGQLADKSDLQAAAIAHFEAGRRTPSLRNLVNLAEALGVTTDHLVGLDKGRRASTVLPPRLAKLASQLTSNNIELIEMIATELLKRQ